MRTFLVARGFATAFLACALLHAAAARADVNSFPALFLIGDQDGSMLGACSTAGDVNGDGFSDVIAGQPQWRNGSITTGRALVFLGGPSGISGTPSWTYTSTESGAQVGTGVSTAGDVNGDGYADIVVGAPGLLNGGVATGSVLLFLGGPAGLGATPAWIFAGTQSGEQMGAFVAPAGDVNGDSYDDILIGAPAYDTDTPATDAGRALLFLGSPSGVGASAAWEIRGNQSGGGLGSTLATAGDVNADGFTDVLVCEGLRDSTAVDEGRAALYMGSAAGLSPAATWTTWGETIFAGIAACTAGDVNGDGYADIIVGAGAYSGANTYEGRAQLFSGSAAGIVTTPAWSKLGGGFNISYGFDVSTAGDVNGDGFADVIIGVIGYSTNQVTQQGEGEVLVYQGSAAGLGATPVMQHESNSELGGEGWIVRTAGDVNGDGMSDVLSGSPFYDPSTQNNGALWLFLGLADTPSALPSWIGEPNVANAQYGCAVADAGDLNGDGYEDVAIGARFFPRGGGGRGAVMIYYGSPSGVPATPNVTLNGGAFSASYGASVCSAGDVNGDGYADLLVGDPNYSNPEVDEGAVYLYYGGPGGVSSVSAWHVEQNLASATLGVSVCGAGDVNGDGYADIAVGAPGYANGQSLEGLVEVFLGGPSGPSTTPAWSVQSDLIAASQGIVGRAGDVNGDGYDDLLVGADGYGNPEASEGRVSLYYGGPGGLAANPGWQTETNSGAALLGFAVGPAGDVNGDGYADILLGAPGLSNGASKEGGAYVYLGALGGPAATPAWAVEGNVFSANFGYSLAQLAGDVNADGYSDILVGAPYYNNGQVGEGRAYVYLGSPTGVATTPVSFGESNQTNANLGFSVALADVNGDGFADVLAGAPGASNGQASEGRVFLAYGNNGDGLDRVPQQRRTLGATPIVVGGASDSPTSVVAHVLGRSAAGRVRVRTEAQVQGLALGFPSSGVLRYGAWTLSGVPVVSRGSTVPLDLTLSTALDGSSLLPNHLYHWRTRTASAAPYFPHSPWFSPPGNAAGEADVRTAAVVAVNEPTREIGASLLRDISLGTQPARDAVHVRFTLGHAAFVHADVWDVAGRRVASLVAGRFNAGSHELMWDARDAAGGRAPSGVYELRMRAGEESRRTSRIVLTR